MGALKKILQEVLRVLKDVDVIVLLVAGPVALTVLFGGVYLNSYVQDIPIAVLDEDNSSMSRMIVQQFRENDRFNIKYEVSDQQELRSRIDSRNVYMGLYIPRNFSGDVANMRSSEILVLVDGTNLVVGNNSFAAASGIIQSIAAGVNIKLLETKGIMPQTAKNMGLVFNFNDRTLYDPRMTYMNYMLLGFVAVFLQQVMLSGVGISLVKSGTEIAGTKTVRCILTKIVSCAVFALSSTTAALAIAAYGFKVPIRGSIFVAFLLCAVFVFAISCPAILMAALTKDKLKFAQIAFMLSLPAFVSCGYVWPQDQMPQAVTMLIKLFWPLINFARPFDEVLVKGLAFEAVKGSIIQMLAYTALWFPISVAVFKRSFRT